jgi:hypothetical protein
MFSTLRGKTSKNLYGLLGGFSFGLGYVVIISLVELLDKGFNMEVLKNPRFLPDLVIGFLFYFVFGGLHALRDWNSARKRLTSDDSLDTAAAAQAANETADDKRIIIKGLVASIVFLFFLVLLDSFQQIFISATEQDYLFFSKIGIALVAAVFIVFRVGRTKGLRETTR